MRHKDFYENLNKDSETGSSAVFKADAEIKNKLANELRDSDLYEALMKKHIVSNIDDAASFIFQYNQGLIWYGSVAIGNVQIDRETQDEIRQFYITHITPKAEKNEPLNSGKKEIGNAFNSVVLKQDNILKKPDDKNI